MDHRIVLMSGPIAVGKTAVANALIEHHGFASIRSGPYLRDLATRRGIGLSRAELQNLGDALDNESDYAWLIDEVATAFFLAQPDQGLWLLDSVRKNRQVMHFRKRHGMAVRHAHFTAPEEVLRTRYEKRASAGPEYEGNTPYAIVATHPNELAARDLIDTADITLNLHEMTARDAAARIWELIS